MVVDVIEHDPAWKGGDYGSEPVEGLRGARRLGENLLIRDLAFGSVHSRGTAEAGGGFGEGGK